MKELQAKFESDTHRTMGIDIGERRPIFTIHMLQPINLPAPQMP